MKTFSERNSLVICAIGVGLTAAAVFGALNYDKLPFVNQRTEYSAYFTEVGGLAPSAPVQVSGLRVGEVNSIDIDGARVLIKFTVEKDVHVGDRTEAAIKTRGLLGAKALELTPGGEGQLHGPIPVEHTHPPYQLPDARIRHRHAASLAGQRSLANPFRFAVTSMFIRCLNSYYLRGLVRAPRASPKSGPGEPAQSMSPMVKVGIVHITDIRVLIHRRETLLTLPGYPATIEEAVLTIATDEGLEGHTFLSPPQPDVTGQLISIVKPRLLGRDPLDIGAIWGELGARRDLDPTVQGYVDVALWDIAGKAAGLPVHRLLGTVRTAIPAYASSWVHDNARDYVQEALAYREQGFSGYKIHPPSMIGPRRQGAASGRRIDTDLAVYREVRDAVGDEHVLFADPFFAYTYSQALRAGRALEDLGYEWFEDPLPADDLYGYARLRQQLRIPLMATELVTGGVTGTAPWASEGVTDYLRSDVVLKGGITGLVKIAHLAEAFHLNCELHDGYNALNNLAVLHVALAIPNCDWYEVLVPHSPGAYNLDSLSWGLVEPIDIDSDGMAHSPGRPGLGIDVDWDLVRSGKAAELT